MRVVVIDGQGGGIGRQLVARLREALPDAAIAAVGANCSATNAMLKAGANSGATGENAVLVACRNADVIAGPIGIAIADSLGGEISPAMAVAVARSSAKRVLLPFQFCDNIIAGVGDYNIARLVQSAVEAIVGISAAHS
ncbi:MAG: DUF3842 family protein [Lentisphaeria bacterium]|nr:DUF3842 family protein [Lentisphaeria bacterium]